MQDDFKGILFTLKKRMQNPSLDDNFQYDYLIFGYYDGLDIRCVDKWFEYRPKGLIKKGLALDIKDEFIDLYTIKALFPKNVNALEEQGFFYTPVLNGEKSEYPCITMSLINISGRFADRYLSYEDMNGAMYDFARAACKDCGCDSLKCTVFPSIGYSDYIMLCFANGFSEPAVVIDRLRKTRLDNGHIAYSGCYTVCGINMSQHSTYNVLEEEDVKLSVKVNLKSGKSANEFISTFIEEMKALSYTSHIYDVDNMKIENDWKYNYHTFGNSDHLFIPDYYLKIYLQLYSKGQLFNPESRFFKDYITNIHSTIRVKEKRISDAISVCECEETEKKKERIRRYQIRYAEFIRKFNLFIQSNNLHKRNLKSLEQVMKNYLNLVQLLHSFDVEVIVGQIFDALIKNLDYVMDLYQNDSEQIDLLAVMESLNEFNEIMRVYITDMAHSDKLFIEGQTLTHPSAGSATKLLFAYNGMMRKLMNIMRTSEKEKALSDFTILVTSGGRDRTNVKDLFSHLGNHKECPKILIATIPEISIYDVKGTAFRLFHECMHFCGKRHRRERYTSLLNTMGRFLAHNIVELLYDDDKLKMYFSEIAIFFDKNCQERTIAEKEVNDIYERNANNLRMDLRRTIVSNQYFDFTGREEIDYYFSRLESELFELDKISEVFLSDIYEKDTLRNNIYSCIKNSQIVLFKALSAYAKNRKINYTVYDSYIKQFEYFNQKNLMDEVTVSFLREYFELFTHGYCDGKITRICDPGYVWRYEELYEAVSGVLKEGFADCFAMKALQMDFADFLLSFIYEEWEIDLALPNYLLNIMRIGADLFVTYEIEGSLDESQNEKIISRAEYWKTQGYEYQNIDKLVERVNTILVNYQELRRSGLTSDIEKYLYLCIKDIDFPICNELVNFYRNCGFNNKEKVYEMMNYMIYEWKGLKDENREPVIG